MQAWVGNAALSVLRQQFNQNKSVEPANAQSGYESSILGGVGTWYGRGSAGHIYRYFSDGTGTAHFSGTIPRAHLPNGVLKQLDDSKLIFGDMKTFAVEIELEDTRNAWLLGRVCYWLDGTKVGDFGKISSLRDYLLQSSSVLMFRGRRAAGKYWDLPFDTAFHIIDKSLYGNVQDEPPLSQDEMLGRFEFRVPVESFDGWGIYLLQHGETERVIFAAKPFDSVRKIEFPAGTCDAAQLAAWEFLNLELDRHRPR